MGVFDFLTRDASTGQPFNFDPGPTPMPTAQQPDLTPQPAPQVPQGGLLEAPTQPIQPPQQPGLMDHLWQYIKSPEGRLAIGTALRASGGEEGAFADQERITAAREKQQLTATAAAEKRALKDKGNRAFKVAYQNGKFDPAAYASVMGDDLDPLTMGKVAKAVSPEGGVSGSYAYTKSPLTGAIEWGGQRPKDYSEINSDRTSTETARHNQVTEGQGGSRLGISEAQLRLARQREGRLGAGGASGAPSWLPPGARVVHVPGT